MNSLAPQTSCMRRLHVEESLKFDSQLLRDQSQRLAHPSHEIQDPVNVANIREVNRPGQSMRLTFASLLAVELRALSKIEARLMEVLRVIIGHAHGHALRRSFIQRKERAKSNLGHLNSLMKRAIAPHEWEALDLSEVIMARGEAEIHFLADREIFDVALLADARRTSGYIQARYIAALRLSRNAKGTQKMLSALLKSERTYDKRLAEIMGVTVSSTRTGSLRPVDATLN